MKKRTPADLYQPAKLTGKPVVKAQPMPGRAQMPRSMVPQVKRASGRSAPAATPDAPPTTISRDNNDDPLGYASGGLIGNTRGARNGLGAPKTSDDAKMNRSGWKQGGNCD